MLVIYSSRTGNVKRFVSKLEIKTTSIDDVGVINAPFVLITYTDKFGEIPKKVDNFLKENHKYLIGVSSSGNRNWGEILFAKSADKISEKYRVPIISKFEMSGMHGDVKAFTEGVVNLYGKMERVKQ